MTRPPPALAPPVSPSPGPRLLLLTHPTSGDAETEPFFCPNFQEGPRAAPSRMQWPHSLKPPRPTSQRFQPHRTRAPSSPPSPFLLWILQFVQFSPKARVNIRVPRASAASARGLSGWFRPSRAWVCASSDSAKSSHHHSIFCYVLRVRDSSGTRSQPQSCICRLHHQRLASFPLSRPTVGCVNGSPWLTTINAAGKSGAALRFSLGSCKF